MKIDNFFKIILLSLLLVPELSIADIPEKRMSEYENKISLSKEKEEYLKTLGDYVYKTSNEQLYSPKHWGKYGSFSKTGMEIQGSLAYGMALSDSSDLDIAFVYKYNNGESMKNLNPVILKKDAIQSFKEVFGNKYEYSIKGAVVNLKNKSDDIDIAFFNVLQKPSTDQCSTYNRCSELNYGKDDLTAEWYLSERLSLYSKFDDVFTKNTEKRIIINRSGKLLKLWRGIVFKEEDIKIPSIALITMLYDFSNEKGLSYPYHKSIDTLRDVTDYGIIKYFKNNKCEGYKNAEINLPVYQKEKNLLSKLNENQRLKTCQELVNFNNALNKAASPNVSEENSVKLLEPFIGKF